LPETRLPDGTRIGTARLCATARSSRGYITGVAMAREAFLVGGLVRMFGICVRLEINVQC